MGTRQAVKYITLSLHFDQGILSFEGKFCGQVLSILESLEKDVDVR